ncbi:MAG: clan AA aspartic protease [Deltaproteobacteria bacterium]|nr:clan AA aspartic protease [Deltaproteobacteria bacterium]
MIEGVVNASREAVIPLTLRGTAGRTLNIEAIIDTGFGGFLTLPPALVAELGLTLEGIGRATLGDGSEITFPCYDVAVLWEGLPRYGLADEANTTPLVGMRLLERHGLYVEVEDGGRVTIEARA